MIALMLAKFGVVAMIGYIIGSIPSGVWIARRVAKVDVREYGSGKTGTTKVLRVAGRKAAAMVVILDVCKGSVAVAAAGPIVGSEYLVWGDFGFGLMTAQVLAALAAIAGHNWSMFLNFWGGRGVATFFGGLIALCPVAALFGGEVIIIGVGLSRFASLGSIAGAVGTYAVLVPLTIINGFPIEYLIYTFIGTVAIIFMHRDNITRLLSGKERRFGEKVIVEEPPSSNEKLG